VAEAYTFGIWSETCLDALAPVLVANVAFVRVDGKSVVGSGDDIDRRSRRSGQRECESERGELHYAVVEVLCVEVCRVWYVFEDKRGKG
jgi:hypothetical protein